MGWPAHVATGEWLGRHSLVRYSLLKFKYSAYLRFDVPSPGSGTRETLATHHEIRYASSEVVGCSHTDTHDVGVFSAVTYSLSLLSLRFFETPFKLRNWYQTDCVNHAKINSSG